MPARGAILAYVREKFGTEPEYPWARYPHYAVLRHQQGRKWYALIMDVPPDRLGLAGDGPVEIINLKSDGVLDLLISGTPGILPAYHMDKRHWVSILLDGGITPEELFALIDASHALTGGPAGTGCPLPNDIYGAGEAPCPSRPSYRHLTRCMVLAADVRFCIQRTAFRCLPDPHPARHHHA